ncbi:MAG: RhuM family protein [Methanobrevibacter sp.]|nr:RhuM family protein [Methanobrevibacter sp.]
MQEVNQIQKTLLFIGDEGAVSIDAIVDGDCETLWANQMSLAEFFDVDDSIIEKHLKRIFNDEELSEDASSAELTYEMEDYSIMTETFYNLDVIISVAYGVKSKSAILMRKWFIKQLSEYLIKGFILDEESLKYGSVFGQHYFDNLVDDVREVKQARLDDLGV